MALYTRHIRKENRGNIPGSNLRVVLGWARDQRSLSGKLQQRARERERGEGREDPLRRRVGEWWSGFLRLTDPPFHYVNYNGGKRTKRRIIEIQLLKMLSSSRLVERAINLALTPLATNIFPCYPTFPTAPKSDSSPLIAFWCLRNEKREGDQSSTHNMHTLL